MNELESGKGSGDAAKRVQQILMAQVTRGSVNMLDRGGQTSIGDAARAMDIAPATRGLVLERSGWGYLVLRSHQSLRKARRGTKEKRHASPGR
jgi:hypothetical protein